MANYFSNDSIEAFQLKECYELSAQFERLDAAKEVLRDRSKKLDISMNDAPFQEDELYPETEMQILSKTIYDLAFEGCAPNEYQINRLPDSAEKEFVLALLSLQRGTGERQRIDASFHISEALNRSPSDPRFIALANILLEAGNKRGR